MTIHAFNESQSARKVYLPRKPWKNPVLQSTSALGGAAFFALAALALDERGWMTLLLWLSTILATLCGLLVLARSAAIRRINAARQVNKFLQDELSRADLYNEQIQCTLKAAVEFRQLDDVKDSMTLIMQTTDALATRASAVFNSQARIYLVQTTAHWHIVKHVAGPGDPFGIAPGKMCSAERSLDEVLGTLGRNWYIVTVYVEGTSHSLVLLAEQRIKKADRMLMDETACVFNLLDEGSGRASKAPRHLHAVL